MHPSAVNWRRLVASGALWAVVYNLIWGIAWFAFMRREWLDAVVALGRPLPWTAEVWFMWVAFTVPLGTAVMAHAASGGGVAVESNRRVDGGMAAVCRWDGDLGDP